MRIFKEGKYIVFNIEENKNVKYDLQLNKTIGKRGTYVKDLKSQLRGITMHDVIENFEDKKYANFLKYVYQKEGNITNIGTVLDRIKYYSNYEQIFSAGFEDIVCDNFKYKINEIPKSLIKIAQIKKIKISNDLIKFYKERNNEYCLAYNLNYISLDKNDIYIILTKKHYYKGEYNRSFFIDMIEYFGYNAKRLLLYIDELKTYEAISNINDLMVELFDYAKMMNEISGKFEKYPKNFLGPLS